MSQITPKPPTSRGSPNIPKKVKEFLSSMPTLVSNHENQQLMNNIEEKEVIEAIWSLDSYKAPRLEDLTISLYRASGI